MNNKKKAFKYGFIFGFVGTFVATLGLAFRFIEIIGTPFLVPTRWILSPVNDTFANLPGLLNILIFATITGIVYALLFYAVYVIFRLFKNQSKVE